MLAIRTALILGAVVAAIPALAPLRGGRRHVYVLRIAHRDAAPAAENITVRSSGGALLHQSRRMSLKNALAQLMANANGSPYPPIKGDADDETRYVTEYATDFNNSLEHLSYTSNATEPSQELLDQEAAAEAKWESEVLPLHVAEIAEWEAYLNEDMPYNDNDLDEFTRNRDYSTSSAQNASASSVQNAAAEAVNSTISAQNASVSSVQNAAAEAVNSTSSAQNASVSSVQNAAAEAVNSTSSAQNASVSSVQNAAAEAVNSTSSAQNASVSSVQNAAAEAVNSTSSAQNASVPSVQNAAVEAVNSTSSAQSASVSSTPNATVEAING